MTEFLGLYPGMAIEPTPGNITVLKGQFSFNAQPENGLPIADSFELEITIPETFPRKLPLVKEVGGRIPHKADWHVYESSGALCLGSPLRLLKNLARQPDLTGFSKLCLLPYLYGISYKQKHKDEFPFGELKHGTSGAIADYEQLLGLASGEQVRKALVLLGLPKRMANKKSCPHGCGLRLGRCSYRYKINATRKLSSRSWFREHLKSMFPPNKNGRPI